MATRPRSYSMGPRPLSAVPLAGPLRDFAFTVYQKKNEMVDAGAIYRLYNAVSQKNQLTLGGGSAETMYLDRLYSLGLVRGQPIVQDFESFTFGSLLTIRRNYLQRSELIPNGALFNHIKPQAEDHGMTPEDYLVAILGIAFYHYSSRNRCTVTQRVYLDVHANDATNVMRMVVSELVDDMAGVDEAKIAGPVAVEDRPDTIVIYTKNETIRDQVVMRLKDFQDDQGVGAFIDKVPAMTERRLPGVSCGAEPAQVKLIRRQAMPGEQSFGTLRADLIFQALKDSRSGPEFFELIVKYFRDAGLNANDPSIQTRCQKLTLEAQRNLVDDIMKGYGP